MEIVGEKWSLLVLREAYFGIRRFDDFHRALGCARNLLSGRLAKLVEHGVLERVLYQEAGHRGRYEYHLTDKGYDLEPALVALMQWGDRWTADADGPPVVMRHNDCGAPVHAVLSCENGHHAVAPQDTRPMPGPGARRIA
ncbi:winged helix-turn-helix transcriptional regulator [Nocardia sp. NPDC052566]|uniref:winged helix-turn-helix transcriptional regulator n=1 Tax=Nocardia sp. NPDC052566 TaxID=3364330 RepID=UPI0037C77C92